MFSRNARENWPQVNQLAFACRAIAYSFICFIMDSSPLARVGERCSYGIKASYTSITRYSDTCRSSEEKLIPMAVFLRESVAYGAR